MHGDDPFMIAAGELVCAQYIFRIVIPDLQQTLIFAFLQDYYVRSIIFKMFAYGNTEATNACCGLYPQNFILFP